jgi:hypothetical protein
MGKFLSRFPPISRPFLQARNTQQNWALRITHRLRQASVGQMAGMCDQGRRRAGLCLIAFLLRLDNYEIKGCRLNLEGHMRCNVSNVNQVSKGSLLPR